jgi:hypothetical protein
MPLLATAAPLQTCHAGAGPKLCGQVKLPQRSLHQLRYTQSLPTKLMRASMGHGLLCEQVLAVWDAAAQQGHAHGLAHCWAMPCRLPLRSCHSSVTELPCPCRAGPLCPSAACRSRTPSPCLMSRAQLTVRRSSCANDAWGRCATGRLSVTNRISLVHARGRGSLWTLCQLTERSTRNMHEGDWAGESTPPHD